MSEKSKRMPPQEQGRQPGRESEMTPRPHAEDRGAHGSGKLQGRRALITGGDSGIGRAVAIAFAKEGADVAIVYLEEHDDARETLGRLDELGASTRRIAGDVGDPSFARHAVEQAVEAFGGLDILVNNAGEQHPTDDFLQITPDRLERTFRTNVFGMFYVTAATLPHLAGGASIINTTSVTAYKGSPHLIDYSATKGAIVAFTRSLALNLAGRGVRVNAVAPGPIWTPLIPATFDAEHVAHFGENVPLGRPGQPEEIAPSFVFLASGESSYFTGQVLHPNGGSIING